MAAHAVAIGLREFVPVDEGIADAMRTATEAGAAIVAAHPSSAQDRGSASAESPVAQRQESRSSLRDGLSAETEPVRGRLTKRFSRDAARYEGEAICFTDGTLAQALANSATPQVQLF